MPIQVELSAAEIMMAATIGAMRRVDSLSKKLTPKHGLTNETNLLAMDIDAACAELAFCKAKDKFFEGRIGNFKDADIGKSIQIRSSAKHDNNLIVRMDDSDDHYFVLVTGICPDYLVHGYIKGRDAKKNQWLKNYNSRPGAYFVPQSELKAIK